MNAPANDASSREAQRAAVHADPPAMNAQILLIEDDGALRNLLETVLKSASYDVWPAPQGREAMKILDVVVIDLIVTDIVMPEQDGIETILQVRRLQPRLPIIAMSGGGQVVPEQYLRMAKVVGATRLLANPVQPADLRKLLDGLLANSIAASDDGAEENSTSAAFRGVFAA